LTDFASRTVGKPHDINIDTGKLGQWPGGFLKPKGESQPKKRLAQHLPPGDEIGLGLSYNRWQSPQRRSNLTAAAPLKRKSRDSRTVLQAQPVVRSPLRAGVQPRPRSEV
jgi:hypothetical protein